MGWVTVRHEQTGGETQIPGIPRVVASYQRRGWRVDTGPNEPDAAQPAAETQTGEATPEQPAEAPTAPAQPVPGDDEKGASAEHQPARRRRSE